MFNCTCKLYICRRQRIFVVLKSAGAKKKAIFFALNRVLDARELLAVEHRCLTHLDQNNFNDLCNVCRHMMMMLQHDEMIRRPGFPRVCTALPGTAPLLTHSLPGLG